MRARHAHRSGMGCALACAVWLGCAPDFRVGDASGSGGGDGSGGGGGQGAGEPIGCDPASPKCPAGHYCAPSARCAPCSPLGDSFQLGPPEVLAISGVGQNPSFPRSRFMGSVEELVFMFQDPGDPSNTDLATTTRAGDAWSVAEPITGAAISTSAAEWAPLPLPEGIQVPGIGFPAVLLYSGINQGQEQIFAVPVDGASRLPIPQVNDDVKDTKSLAFSYAAAAPRYWYMRRVGVSNALRFVTQPADGTSDYVQLTPPSLPGGCVVDLMETLDMAPWVTPDGEYLLFQAAYPTGCGTAGLWRGFYVRVGNGSVPIGEAQELPLDSLPPDAAVRTPAFSQDLCTLYFASDFEGEPALYAARRR